MLIILYGPKANLSRYLQLFRLQNNGKALFQFLSKCQLQKMQLALLFKTQFLKMNYHFETANNAPPDGCFMIRRAGRPGAEITTVLHVKAGCRTSSRRAAQLAEQHFKLNQVTGERPKCSYVTGKLYSLHINVPTWVFRKFSAYMRTVCS